MSDEQTSPGAAATATTAGPLTGGNPASSGPGVPTAETAGAVGAPARPGRDTDVPYPAPPPDDPPPHGPQPPRASGDRPRRHRRTIGIVAAAVLAGVIGGAGGFGGAYALLDGHAGSPVLPSVTSTANPALPGTVAGAASTAMPSTVDIRVNLSQGTAEGSGVILTANGDVLTNNHVVAGAAGPITVTLADGSQHQATVVGTAPSYDLAVVKIQGVSGLTPAILGSSANLVVGQQDVAIGSPQGLSGTVTSGIVSALNRTVAVQTTNGSVVVYNGLQTDAPINPGNSGGPLVNLQGQVIGIDSAIATAGSQGSGQTSQGGSIGLGFAIPVDQAKRVAQEIMTNGAATKPVLGVQGNADAAGTNGAQLAAVAAGSPAAQAGLVAGEVVTKVDNAAVQNFADLIARVGAHAPGDTVTLTVTTATSTRNVPVTLGSTPDTSATTASGQNTGPSGSGTPFGQRGPFGGGN